MSPKENFPCPKAEKSTPVKEETIQSGFIATASFTVSITEGKLTRRRIVTDEGSDTSAADKRSAHEKKSSIGWDEVESGGTEDNRCVTNFLVFPNIGDRDFIKMKKILPTPNIRRG